MRELDNILENRSIKEFVRHYARSPHQSNVTHESDAEIIDMGTDSPHYLAITIDTIADEISEGLYKDPFTMGWVLAMSNFSDLAAVGADPLGIVTALSLECSRGRSFRKRIAQGMEKACRRIGTFILGGDLNITPSISLTGCAIGTVPKNNKLTRIGCKEGDAVFLSGRIGSGNALGLARKMRLTEDMVAEESYRPIARTREAQMIRGYASCCMDTSDGLFITIDQLIRLNHQGFSIRVTWEKLLDRNAFQLCKKMNVPFWFMAAGIHGEFELVFTVPAKKVSSFLKRSHRMDFHPIPIGRITELPHFELTLGKDKTAVIDMAPLRNLWGKSPFDLNLILEKHYSLGKTWGLN